MTTVSRISRENEAGLRAPNVLPLQNLALCSRSRPRIQGSLLFLQEMPVMMTKMATVFPTSRIIAVWFLIQVKNL